MSALTEEQVGELSVLHGDRRIDFGMACADAATELARQEYAALLESFNAVQFELANLKRRDQNDAQCFRELRAMCGYVENGSDTVVKIFQDDATRDWFVKVGQDSPSQKSRRYFGPSLLAAIQAAVAAGETAE